MAAVKSRIKGYKKNTSNRRKGLKFGNTSKKVIFYTKMQKDGKWNFRPRGTLIRTKLKYIYFTVSDVERASCGIGMVWPKGLVQIRLLGHFGTIGIIQKQGNVIVPFAKPFKKIFWFKFRKIKGINKTQNRRIQCESNIYEMSRIS